MNQSASTNRTLCMYNVECVCSSGAKQSHLIRPPGFISYAGLLCFSSVPVLQLVRPHAIIIIGAPPPRKLGVRGTCPLLFFLVPALYGARIMRCHKLFSRMIPYFLENVFLTFKFSLKILNRLF